MKGVEGLPLKYIAIVLVAAIVIAAVYSIVTNFTSSAQQNTERFNKTASGALNVSNAKLCSQACGGDDKYDAAKFAADGECACK